MKVIQVGLGLFGMSWLSDVLLQHEQIEVIAVVDCSQEQLKRVQEDLGISQSKTFTSLEQAIAIDRPDFVLNVTPPAVHRIINSIAIGEKIPILCEKPIAESLEDVLGISSDARESGVPLMIAENYRYSTLMQEIKKILISGEMGDITDIQINFRRYHQIDNYHKHLEHPMLLDVGIHHLDCLRYMTGREGKSVFARTWTPSWSHYKGFSDLDFNLLMDGDIRVNYHGTLSSKRTETDFYGDWYIGCVNGTLSISGNKIEVFTEDKEYFYQVEQIQDSRNSVLNEFMAALNEGRTGDTDIMDNVKTYAIARAIIESTQKNKDVEIDWR